MKSIILLWFLLVSFGANSAEYEWLAHTTAATDAISTKLGIDNGIEEGNSIYGKNPSNKTIALSLIYRIGLIRFVNATQDKETARDFNTAISTVQLLTTGNNIILTYEHQF